jgi:hypothetical protein
MHKRNPHTDEPGTAKRVNGPSMSITTKMKRKKPALKRFTAFCQQANGRGTIWIDGVEAKSMSQAIKIARSNCAFDWGYDPKDVHVLGIASGDITIEFWEDID